jgi:Flp pilus assembly protein TadD
MMPRKGMFNSALAATVALSTLVGCAPVTGGFFSRIPERAETNMVESKSLKIAKDGIDLIQVGDFEGASRQFNAALKLEITNSSIQFLNGLAYHLRALQGDVSYFPLAEQGYQLAIQYDRTNWLAYYYKGLARMDQRDFKGAQEFFSEALLYRDNDPDLLYGMTVSSYYAQDPEVAAAALEQLRALVPEDPKALEASAMVMAALGNGEEAQGYLTQYVNTTGNGERGAVMEGRLDSWERVYKRARTSKISTVPLQVGLLPQLKSGSSGGAKDEVIKDPVKDDYKMVIVDVVIIRTEEDISSSKGINLLNGLTLQFGSTNLSEAGFSYQSSNAKTPSGTLSKTITRALNIPSITYSLNIANSSSDRNEILARPTLVALAGEKSEFFSGLEIEAAAIGGNNSDGSTVKVQKEIGVKLALQPEFLDDGRVKLNVVAERTFLTTPNTNSVTFELRIDTSKTSVSANVAMNFGETLILSGLSEKETERARDGVPFLQDIPGLQYLFSKRTTRDFQKSVLILMTPRPPSYTYQSDRQREQTRQRQNSGERALSELQARYSDWFKPYPNWASAFHHMQDNTLYREFRTGDVTMERWANSETLKSRLIQAIDFLYY